MVAIPTSLTFWLRNASRQGLVAVCPFVFDGLEERRLLKPQPDVDGDRDHDEREHERDPPSPVVERRLAERFPRPQDHGEGQDDPEGGGSLQPPRVVPALLVGHVLGDVGNRTAVFPAEAEALDQAEQEEDERRRDADAGIARHDPDQGRGQAHAGERKEEGVLAAHAVADAAEQQRPEGPDQEAHGKERHRAQEGCHRVGLLEELDGEHRSQAAEDVEVVPLDDVPNRRGGDDPAQLPSGEIGGGHRVATAPRSSGIGCRSAPRPRTPARRPAHRCRAPDARRPFRSPFQ